MEPAQSPRVVAPEFAPPGRNNAGPAQTRTIVRVLPNDRTLPKDPESHRDAKHESRETKREQHRDEKHDRKARHDPRREAGTPLPESTEQLPPLIRRQEVVAFALVGLLLIAVTTVLYFAKAFFLPV